LVLLKILDTLKTGWWLYRYRIEKAENNFWAKINRIRKALSDYEYDNRVNDKMP